MLQRAGFATTEACDGAQAIEKIRENRFAAIVLDLMMPRVSGFDVLRFLGDHMPDRKCVIVVSAASRHVIDGLDTSLICARFRKPFDIDEVVNAVRSCAMT